MASVLESFSILFETDADQLAVGTELALGAVDALENRVQETDATTEQLGESFNDLISSAREAIFQLIGFGALTAGLINAAEEADELGKFADVLGLNIEEVDAWGQAVERSGGSAEGFRTSVENLTRQLTDFTLTGKGDAAAVLARLGISALDSGKKVRSAFDVLPELADSFENLTRAEAVGFGQRLGLDQATILLLQQGRREVDELVRRQRQLGMITQQDAEIAAEFNDAWADTRQVFNRLFTTANATVLPLFTQIFNAINRLITFLRENEDLVIGLFVGAGAAIATIYLPAVIRAAAATLVALSPFLAVSAAVAAIGVVFALVYEDIIAFREGNESLIGLLVDKYPLVGTVIDSLTDAFNFLWGTIKEVFSALVNLPNDVEGSVRRLVLAIVGLLRGIDSVFDDVVKGLAEYFIELLPDSVVEAAEAMKATFTAAGEFILSVFQNIGDVLAGVFANIVENFKAALPDIGGIGQALRNLFGIEDDREVQETGAEAGPEGAAPVDETVAMEMDDRQRMANLMAMGQEKMRLVENNPLAGQTTNSIINTTNTSNRTTSVSVGTVSVDARGGDSRDVANNVGTALSDQMKQALSDFDDGVAA